jgi:diaminohydroxyphosphoribosylaminopyrimidine deaminase / 5-amino-6-(5-phosphoribosylamino)uracil reductase
MDGARDDGFWPALLSLREGRGGGDPAPCPPPSGGDGGGARDSLFAPLLVPPRAADGCVVVGRLAQTLDGRIATLGGSSQWIGGRGDILHTHRLRALCDAVVVGAATVHHDDPLLTTREVPGPDPVRVVLDADRHLGAEHRVFRQPGPPTLLLCAEDAPGPGTHGLAEVVRAARGPAGRGLSPPAVLRALAARGLTRILVEGGGVTVSRFLAAGCLDRLHLTVAPVLLGSGVPAFTLPPAARIADGLRLAWTAHAIPPDILFDVALDRARPGWAAVPSDATAADADAVAAP